MNSFSPRDFQEWVDRRQSTHSSSTVSSASTSVLFPSPATSPGSSSRKQSWQFYDDVVRLELTPSVQMSVLRKKKRGSRQIRMRWLVDSSFVKNGQLFKLKYKFIDICKDSTGALRCLELGGGLGQQTPFIHGCELSRIFPKDNMLIMQIMHSLQHKTASPPPRASKIRRRLPSPSVLYGPTNCSNGKHGIHDTIII